MKAEVLSITNQILRQEILLEQRQVFYESMYPEDITSMSGFISDKSLKTHKAETDIIEGEIHNSPIILGDFNPLLLITDRMTRQKISKNIENFN